MNNRLWFTGDPHFSHANILHLCNRPFPNIFDHDRTIIGNINSVVSPRDDLFILGDVAYKCDPSRIVQILEKLNGRIHILCGNHDKYLIRAVEAGMLDDMLKSEKLIIFGLKAILEDYTIGIYKMINVEGQLIFLSHYGVRTWPNAFRGSWHLYGHSHSRLPPLYKSMDCGVDMETETHQRFFPWSYEEIRTEMEKKTDSFSENPNPDNPYPEDHHDTLEN